MTVHRYLTPLPSGPPEPGRTETPRGRLPWIRLGSAAVAVALVGWLVTAAQLEGGSLSGDATITLTVFLAAVWCWVFTGIDDTYVALGAALVLVLTGALPTDTLFETLGQELIWLLVAAFVIAAAVRESGLATRGAAWVISAARTPRQLVHLVTLVLVATTFAIPSTSGRAALALPIFLALALSLDGRPALVSTLAVLFPSVILLSAVGSFLGAGAHVITSQILSTSGSAGFTFAGWMVLGLPLALVSAHLCAELVMALFLPRAERRVGLSVAVSALQREVATPLTGPLTVVESRTAGLLAVVIALWCTEPLHGLSPALVALIGALVATSPRFGMISLGRTLGKVPWSLLLFMAATLAMGTALVDSGAAAWLAARLFAPLTGLGAAAGPAFVVVVVLVSTAAHLLITSRSARSAVLVPIVVALAPAFGINPAAAALASTAAAGFCHTLPSSAKPVAMFAAVEDRETYTPRDLLRLSVFLAPLSAALVLLFATVVWPLLGLPLHSP